jgi:uncharacterized membrane protein YjjP (DUF1212 family)
MRKRDEIDEDVLEEEEEEKAPRRVRRRSPPYPITVLIAGIAWIGFGGLLLLSGTIFAFALAFVSGKSGHPGDQAVGIAVGVFLVDALFAAAFIYVGIQSVQGTAPGTVGNGIGSIVYGLVNLAFGISEAQKGDVLTAVSVFIAVAGLWAAGALALVGTQDYRRWREVNKPQKKRKRR